MKYYSIRNYSSCQVNNPYCFTDTSDKHFRKWRRFNNDNEFSTLLSTIEQFEDIKPSVQKCWLLVPENVTIRFPQPTVFDLN